MQGQEKLQSEINKAAQILKKGGVVIFPTDTVFGLGCLFDSNKALARIYEIKNRPQTLPLPILVSKIEEVEKLAYITPLAKSLINKYWPGALTLVLKAKKSNQKLGFRLPNSKITLSLIEEAGKPIIGTSANFHGQSVQKNSKDLPKDLIDKVDFTVEGISGGGVESTVVDASGQKPKVIRQGAINIRKTGNLILKIDSTNSTATKVELVEGRTSEQLTSDKLGSQVLLPLIVKILKKHKKEFNDLSQIQVRIGPGSFTGTRVGVTIANALGYALNIPVNGKKGKIVTPVYSKSKFD